MFACTDTGTDRARRRACDVEQTCRSVRGAGRPTTQLRDDSSAPIRKPARGAFGERPGGRLRCLLRDCETAGYALFFPTFSSFRVIRGIGYETCACCRAPQGGRPSTGAAVCRAGCGARRGTARLEWAMRSTRKRTGARFYRGLGARCIDGWTVALRLDALSSATPGVRSPTSAIARSSTRSHGG